MDGPITITTTVDLASFVLSSTFILKSSQKWANQLYLLKIILFAKKEENLLMIRLSVFLLHNAHREQW